MPIKEHLERGREYYLSRAPKEIEKNRKGDFCLDFVCDGKPIKNARVRFDLARHDYNFGSNIFMLDQYDTEEENQKFLSLWKGLFNTAVVPLYWEGTEPVQGALRYDADAADDIYRRPPAEKVLNFCKANGIEPKGHPLFWHEFIPRWLPEDFEELYPLIEKRFSEIAQRFACHIPVFDCVNEPSRIWDMTHEHKSDGYKMVAPPEGYVEKIFALAERYFPENELVINEATSAAFTDCRGCYSGYYLHIKELLSKGIRVDKVGFQCHVSDDWAFKNIFNAERLYSLLDCYGTLNRPLVLSEIGISCNNDEELQAQAAEQLYTIWFSHCATSGIFWWNLDDNGILVEKSRSAGAENLPDSGLCRNGRPKAAYNALYELINNKWHTKGTAECYDGKLTFRGFYGKYNVEVEANGRRFSSTVDLSVASKHRQTVELV